MNYHASDTEGIGGKLRVAPKDFLVEEIPLIKKGGTSGPFLICQLTKTNWELGHAIKEIAKRLGISHRRIGWAGTKDRNAITRQWISLYNVTAEQVAGIHLTDIILEPLGLANESLSLGDLLGNHFDIVIRDAEPVDLEQRVNAIKTLLFHRVSPIISGSSVSERQDSLAVTLGRGRCETLGLRAAARILVDR